MVPENPRQGGARQVMELGVEHEKERWGLGHLEGQQLLTLAMRGCGSNIIRVARFSEEEFEFLCEIS